MKLQTPKQRRDFLIYYARVLLREAQARRGQNVDWMLAGAGRARREAMAIDVRPAQLALFDAEVCA
ncbi:hypothetical protein [Mesorhizobium sp.]|uniref:hypothetical protein n=1 Tax=Mesorhizobium sp. TaxID=1871066 RepID=UPI000FE92558|nr:hypothetical protein [Mesorhizobium sp.]RWC25890.1 MAG: hypothetical protein EOS27_26940 [Mesorhizobium sp.]TIX20440.1 MAG: hypothetical protein E5V35_32670 [Mesorhizobium sp.]